jgi:outer membrane cobalamin receptor
LSTYAVHAQDVAPSTVVVAGKRADVINKIDRKVYRNDADIQASTGNAADLLNNIPAVDIDVDGNVTLRGDASVTVLVDGMPSSQMQGAARGGALMGLSAADIEQIEIITSPSAEFKPDGTGGIINIVTKKSRKPGGAGQLLAKIGKAL